MKNSEDADRVGKRGEAKHRRCPLVEILEWGTRRMQIALGRGERPNIGGALWLKYWNGEFGGCKSRWEEERGQT